MREFLLLFGLGLSFAQPLQAAGGPAYWSRMDAEAHGDLGRMLQVIEGSEPLRQLRLNLPLEELASALEAAGRFEALGLSAIEGRLVLEAFYRKHGLDVERAAPPGVGDPSEEALNPDYRAGREFDPLSGVLLRWPSWSQRVLKDEYAVMVETILAGGATPKIWVDSHWKEISAERYLRRQGVDVSGIEWIIEKTDSIWMRDYGPMHIYDPDSTDWGVVDFHYYDGRPHDDDTPLEVAEMNGVDVVDRQFNQTLYTEGGNINTDGEGAIFYSTRTYDNNPGLLSDEVDARITSALNSLGKIVLDDPTLDATGHVDMFMKIVSSTTVLVARYDPDETDYQILEDNAALIASSLNGMGEPWNVRRIRQPDVYYANFVWPVVRTYTNSLILNDQVIVPTYDIPDDAQALAVYAEVFPGKTIVPLNANDIIEWSGAWHCVTMEFPEPGTP